MNTMNDFIYEPIDLYECCFPYEEPPLSFLEECRKYWERREAFSGVTRRKIGNTWYVIETVCDGNEPLTDKVKRLIFSDKEAVCS